MTIGDPLRVAVIGDIHANIRGLEAALTSIAVKGFDHLVINGDLLTYGTAALPVVDRIGSLTARADVTLLAGNHDLLYVNAWRAGSSGGTAAVSPSPAKGSEPHWLAESVEWTRAQAGVCEAMGALPWRSELVLERVLFAHANPFGPGDWTYIRSEVDVARARQTLGERGLRGGVFGHVHRSRFHDGRNDTVVSPRFSGRRDVEEFGFAALDSGIMLGIGGSVGQPRGGAAVAEYTIVEIGKRSISTQFGGVGYDVDRHLTDLRESSLSAATVNRLSQFFRGAR
jgi:hypothetical protein